MRYLYILLVVLLVGCTTLAGPSPTQVVDVPITKRCEPTMKITQITDVFDQAKKEMTLEQKIVPLIAELEQYKGQNKELQAALKECTK